MTFEPLAMDALTFTRLTELQTPSSRGMQVLDDLFPEACDKTGLNSVIEVGSWAGANAIHLADQGLYVYCVDTWRGSPTDVTGVIASAIGGPRAVFKTFCRNIGKRLHRSVFPCVGSSQTWASVWKVPVAGIFIDADHEYESVKEDIEAWWPHVAPGGVLAGHDYLAFPGVKRAVDEWLGEPCDAPSDEHGTQSETWWRWKPETAC